MRYLHAINGWLSRWLALVLTGIFAVAAFSVIEGSSNHSQDQAQIRGQAACFARFANQLYDSLAPRQEASEALQRADQEFNSALVRLLEDSLSGKASDAARIADAHRVAAAAQHKQDVASDLSVERAANPYPSPPKRVCPT